jgi:hypothetical protein
MCVRGRKCKLYRFDNDSGEWKERGVGQTRLLRSNDSAKIRLLMRQEKTLKIRANHFGAPAPVPALCGCTLPSMHACMYARRACANPIAACAAAPAPARQQAGCAEGGVPGGAQ